MAPSAPNTTPNPHDQRPAKGSLEDVFRQKFAEADVTPRASLWDQLDHELLVQQNDTYRRRLALHRWAAAACLLLLLGGGVWATWRHWTLNNGLGTTSETVASAEAGQPGSQLPGVQGSVASAEGRAAAGRVALGTAAASGTGVEGLGLGGTRDIVAASPTSTNDLGASTSGTTLAALNPAGAAPYASSNGLYSQPAVLGDYRYGTDATLVGGSAFGSSTFGGMALRTIRVLVLGGRPDTLKPALLAVPQAPATPTDLAATTAPDDKPAPTKLWRRLRVAGTYAAAAYNPNINFSRSDGSVKADPVTVALRNYYQDDAEQEYRRNLRAGLSQRVALAAAYALNDRWTITGGAEVAEHRATSATTYGFLDGQQPTRLAADLFRPAAAPPVRPEARTTSYRYRTASVPVMVRYGSTKPGVSLYAKVGAAVGVLLSSRSELQDSPEATRTYTLSSKDSPYRQVLTSARAGAGVRYQPAEASWSVAVGPTAEMGLTTLNANPSQRLLRQSRPYSVGLEASVEFGSVKAAPAVLQ